MAKIFHDLWDIYWWNSIKKDIASFVEKCLNFQQVKVKHQKTEHYPKILLILLVSGKMYIYVYIS